MSWSCGNLTLGTMSCQAIVFALVLSVFTVDGARRINIQERMLRARRELSGPAASDPRTMMGLGRGEDLKLTKEVPISSGHKKMKFQETYDDLPIAGASLVLEEDERGDYTKNAIGSLVEGLDEDMFDTLPQLDVNEVLHLVARKNMDNPYQVSFDPDRDAKLEVMLEDTLTDTVNPRLIYSISYRVETDEKLSRPFALVDAISGEIMKQWEGLSINSISRVQSNYKTKGVGGNLKIGKMNYGKEFPNLQITKTENGTCLLTNNVARVYSCNNSWWCSEYTEVPFYYDCDTGFDDAINGAYSPLNDALFYISATYEMFQKWYGIEHPLQRPGTNESFCSARVHFGEAFENAFWDGYYITFGDGNSTFYPLTSINVVAHEIAHGITEMNSGLLYWGESGGMNEAFSDMAGEVVEYFALKETDWMIGFEIFKDEEKALRYFVDPKEDGRSIGELGDYCPGMDPHYSSGLFNRAFYFLAETEGWDPRSAYHPFVLANSLYWMEGSRFYEAACDVVQAAKDLKMDSKAVTEAFRKVGIEPCVDTSSGITAMSEINAPAGHTVIYHLDLTKEMDVQDLRISVLGGMPHVTVHSPACDHCALNARSYVKSIEICNAVPGLYMIEITPQRDMVKGMVLIYGPSQMLVENATIANKSQILEMEVAFPESIIKNKQSLSLRLNVLSGFVIGLLRHEAKPDFKDFKFDYVLGPWWDAMMCTVKPGKWYLSLKTWSNSAKGIDVMSTVMLDGKRVDTPPKNTRPPPTAPAPEDEGSGSS